MYGLRFGKLLADLLFDRKSFAIGALHDSIWKAYDTPIRVPMVAGGTDLNAAGDTTATPRRRPVREWPAPVPQDGDDFLRRRPADAMTLGWQKFTDPATEREFHYHVASHTSQAVHESHILHAIDATPARRRGAPDSLVDLRTGRSGSTRATTTPSRATTGGPRTSLCGNQPVRRVHPTILH